MGESIEDCGTDFEIGYLTIEGARHDALTEQLEAVHFRFDEAAAMIAAPLLPDGASKPFERIERFIAGSRAGAILLPWSSVAADRNDRMSIARSYRGMALFGVVRAVPTDTADLLIFRDLCQQIGEDRGIANRVGGDFNSPDIKRFCVDPERRFAVMIDSGFEKDVLRWLKPGSFNMSGKLVDSGISRICHPPGLSLCWSFIASPYRSKVNITNFAPTRSSRNGSEIEEFNCLKRDPEMDYPTILERELTTFRPPAGEIESAKIIQREDGKWHLRLGISWKNGHEFDICLYDKRIIKTYSSIVSAVRHVCESYDYDGRIILFPNKGQSIK